MEIVLSKVPHSIEEVEEVR